MRQSRWQREAPYIMKADWGGEKWHIQAITGHHRLQLALSRRPRASVWLLVWELFLKEMFYSHLPMLHISIAHISIHPQHFAASHSSFPPAAHMQPNNPPFLFVPDETFIPFDKCTVRHANVLLEAFVVWKVIANQLLIAVSLVSLDFVLFVVSVILTSPLVHSIKRWMGYTLHIVGSVIVLLEISCPVWMSICSARLI